MIEFTLTSLSRLMDKWECGFHSVFAEQLWITRSLSYKHSTKCQEREGEYVQS